MIVSTIKQAVLLVDELTSFLVKADFYSVDSLKLAYNDLCELEKQHSTDTPEKAVIQAALNLLEARIKEVK